MVSYALLKPWTDEREFATTIVPITSYDSTLFRLLDVDMDEEEEQDASPVQDAATKAAKIAEIANKARLFVEKEDHIREVGITTAILASSL